MRGGHPRFILLGIDGLDPRLVEAMMAKGELASFRRLRETGGLSPLATSCPAVSPNAWTCIATGADAGQHGVFDFIVRDPETYLPHLAVLQPGPRGAMGLGARTFRRARRCPAFWDVLSQAGVPTTVLRWPVTFPPDEVNGRMLPGLGVPDLRGGLGTYTFYTTRKSAADEAGGDKVAVVAPRGNAVETDIRGPDVAGLTGTSAARIPLRIAIDPIGRRVTLTIARASRELHVGQWSGVVRLRFKTGPVREVAGMARFYLKAVRPHLELYLSPIELDPREPAFPISSPGGYARELAEAIGTFHTLGIPEDTTALSDGRLDADAFLHLCHQIEAERERMLLHELGRFQEGLLALVADTSDRVQHMFWATRDRGHPLYDEGFARKYAHVIPDVYRHADRLVGHALAQADERTMVLVVSDHGFAPFRRAVHLNTWLEANGFLHRKGGGSGEDDTLFQDVVWEETSAYALGFGGIYINRKGREGQGVFADGSECQTVCDRIAATLSHLRDPATGTKPVRRVYRSEEIFHGPHAGAGPDIVVGFEPGYRASWQTALGGAPDGIFADNRKHWSGDHIVDPSCVPGIIGANRRGNSTPARQGDVVPAVLDRFGLSAPLETSGCDDAG
jgi:predicted AlkP superfamily phosphohydrolase/phosphomutase